MGQATATQKTHHIVVGFDFSELSERAAEQAIEIASRRMPSELHVVVVTMATGPMLLLPESNTPVLEEKAREVVRQRVTRMIEEYQAKNGPLGIEQISVYVLPGLSPGQTGHLIVGVAKEVDAELIVVGTHGRKGMQRVLLGSVAEKVLREATMSVYVVRPEDFVGGRKVPQVQPPLGPGQPHLKHFVHRHTIHLWDRSSDSTAHTMPVT